MFHQKKKIFTYIYMLLFSTTFIWIQKHYIHVIFELVFFNNLVSGRFELYQHLNKKKENNYLMGIKLIATTNKRNMIIYDSNTKSSHIHKLN